MSMLTKEQVKEIVRGNNFESVAAVSYTHLDVYKRQVFCYGKKP